VGALFRSDAFSSWVANSSRIRQPRVEDHAGVATAAEERHPEFELVSVNAKGEFCSCRLCPWEAPEARNPILRHRPVPSERVARGKPFQYPSSDRPGRSI
jgi:hypothetical protein